MRRIAFSSREFRRFLHRLIRRGSHQQSATLRAHPATAPPSTTTPRPNLKYRDPGHPVRSAAPQRSADRIGRENARRSQPYSVRQRARSRITARTVASAGVEVLMRRRTKIERRTLVDAFTPGNSIEHGRRRVVRLASGWGKPRRRSAVPPARTRADCGFARRLRSARVAHDQADFLAIASLMIAACLPRQSPLAHAGPPCRSAKGRSTLLDLPDVERP